MKINILQPSIFNRIAAGEVVDKPASIVKELVENSIDAKADSITIEIENGGIDFISVQDNGVGIETEELPKAFMPHATSKIATVDDLNKIATLGFRGEALASIAAVADVEITSRTQSSFGATIKSIDTVVGEVIETGAPEGTCVKVSSLFKNIPARAKFLRKPKQEESEITNLVEKLILTHPEIRFNYIVNGKQIYLSTGNGLEEAIYVIYGKDILNNIVPINYETSKGYSLNGFISKPTFSKANRNYQTFICNGRYVQNQTVSIAVQNAYSAYMMKGQFPFFVLTLNLPVEDVDVNVHPNKLDIKFVDKNLVFGLIYNKISDTLIEQSTKVSINNFELKSQKNEYEQKSSFLNNENIKNQSAENLEKFLFGKQPKVEISAIKQVQQSKVDNKANNEINIIKESGKQETFIKQESFNKKEVEPISLFDNIIKSSESPIKNLETPIKNEKSEENKNILSQPKENDIELKDNSSVETIIEVCKTASFQVGNNSGLNDYGLIKPKENQSLFGEVENSSLNLKIIGTIFSTYILVEKGDLFIIDQHAGHERLLYDKFTKALNEKKNPSQPLLLPYSFSVSTLEVNFIEENISNFEDLGFEISQTGEKTFTIYAVPMILGSINLPNFMEEILSDISGFRKLNNSDLVKDKIKQISCKKAIKAGYTMKQGDIELLLKLTEENQTALMCPHGRPSIIRITKKDLEKWFKRAV